MKCFNCVLAGIFLAVIAQAGAQMSPPDHTIIVDKDGIPVGRAAYEERTRQADKLRIAGEQALRKGEKAKAIALLKQAIQIDANAVEANLLLADIYIKDNRPADVVAILQPVIYPASGDSSSLGQEVETRLKYILALLDMRRWEEAATLYEKSLDYGIEGRKGNLRWDIPGYGIGAGGKGHFLPDVHFSPEIAEEAGLRAQAHLILGTRRPRGMYGKDAPIEMLDHLQQALKSDRHSLDAQFLIGVVLGELGRFDEARKAFAATAKKAPKEAQPEIKAAVARYTLLEQTQKSFELQEAKRQTEQKTQAQSNTAP